MKFVYKISLLVLIFTLVISCNYDKDYLDTKGYLHVFKLYKNKNIKREDIYKDSFLIKSIEYNIK